MPSLSFPLALAIASFAASLAAQQPATVPHWSSYFGTTGDDDLIAVGRGPGAQITVVGTTNAGGNIEATIARFDPNQPPAQQLVWSIAFGGNGTDIALDAAFDAAGNVTVVGVTTSTNFPVTGTALQPTLAGPGDGFLARFDATGALTYATYLGGSGYDRITGVVALPNGSFAVLGCTESPSLPYTAATVHPNAFGGNSDAFVGRLDPTGALPPRLTFLGSSGSNGMPFSTYLTQGGFPAVSLGNLRRGGLAVVGADLVVATTNQNGTPFTTPGALQSVSAGLVDIYLVQIDQNLTTIAYASLLGGAGGDWAQDIAQHPAGGVVLAGITRSTNFPITLNAYQTVNHLGAVGAADGFVAWFDATQPAPLRYSSYFGGDGGEELFDRIAVDGSGLVTLAGSGFGGGAIPFPTTPGSLQTTANAGNRCGTLMRLHLPTTTSGTTDLVYSSLVGGVYTLLQGIAVDDVGDTLVVGRTSDPGYPTTANAWQPSLAGGDDGVIMHLPLQPGGTSRHDLAYATPACSGRIYSTAIGAPVAGNLGFAIGASNAPATTFGTTALALGTPLTGGTPPSPLPMLNAWLLVNLVTTGPVAITDAVGYATFALPIPPGTPTGIVVQAQCVYLTTLACPGSGFFATSERLEITTL